jgi:hypothetical protein
MNINSNSNINKNDDDALLVVSLEEELNNLRRHKRQQYQKGMQHSHLPLLNEWQFRLAALQQKQHAQAITKSSKLTADSMTAADKEASESYYNQSWHVLGDVFLIWHRGPFATINGFRLGRCAITTAGRVEKYAATATTADTTNANASSTPGSSFVAMIGNTATTNSTTTDATTTATTTSTTSEQPKKVIVPWNEINSALGQVAFLLFTLQYNTPNSRIKFTNHVLQPCGGTSKIGVLKNRQVQQQQQQTGSSSNYNNERRRITALAAYNANSSNNSMLDNNTTTFSTIGNNSRDANTNNTSLPSPRLSLLYQLASSTSSTNDGSIMPNVAAAGGGGVTWYNLYHYEENGSLLSMGYYARRNFNMALESLLYCIIEACVCVVEYDVRFTILYDMSCNGLAVTGSSNNNGPTVMSMSTRTTGKLSDGGGGSRTNNTPHRGSKSTNNNAASNSSSSSSGGKGGGTVGGAMVNGIALFYDPANGEQWTLVCKYLLTNVKWLITYAAKHCC